MFLNFFHLQAAMGLGIFLYMLGVFLLCTVFPAVWIITAFRRIRKIKRQKPDVDWRDYFVAICFGLLISALTLLCIAVLVFLCIFFFVDLSHS